MSGLNPIPQLASAIESSPQPYGIKRVLAKQLLNTGQQSEAIPLLHELQAAGDPEGAFFLGVLAEENNEPGKALRWYEVAASLNPGHAETQARIGRLRHERDN
jgi:predicted Zn-dependent protease